jgi:hypothetical protein
MVIAYLGECCHHKIRRLQLIGFRIKRRSGSFSNAPSCNITGICYIVVPATGEFDNDNAGTTAAVGLLTALLANQIFDSMESTHHHYCEPCLMDTAAGYGASY